MHAFVTSRLDNFNSLLYGIPKKEIKRLQRIQNAAARIITKTKSSCHITPILRQIHWLPILQRIDYKICLLTFKSLHGLAPKYITGLIHKVESSAMSHRSHRSEEKNLLIVPSSRLVTFGDRSSSVAAPKLWNNLPADCRAITKLSTFKSELKTWLFKQAFMDV